MVNEHRITLGRWEREQVKEVKDAVNVALIGTGVGIASVGIGGTYVAYKIGKALYDWGEDLVDDFKTVIENDPVSSSKAWNANPVGKLIYSLLGL